MALSDQELKSLLEKAEHACDRFYNPSEHRLRHAEEAVGIYNQIIENTGPNPLYFMKRACIKSAFASLKDDYLEGAVEDFKRAIKIEKKAIPDDASYWKAKGDTLVNLKRYEEALNAYDKTIELEPDWAYAWKIKADILKKKLFRYEESYDCYYEAAKYYGDSIHSRLCYDQIIETYIFDIPRKYENSKLETELNEGIVSNELRELFKENNYSLSERVEVNQIKEDEMWRIKDKDKVYKIKNQYPGLSIYIENDPPHPYPYMRRALLWDASDIQDLAIGDMSRAIELDPGQGKYYKYRGAWLLKKHWKDRGEFKNVDEKLVYENVTTDYKMAIETDPTDPETWLDLLELNMLLHNWDDTISFYGSSGLYIHAQEEQLIRSFFGCLALALAGDPIGEEDTRPLYEQTNRIKLSSRISRITSESFIEEIRSEENYSANWQKAIEIYKLFIEHLDDWEERGDILGKLKCYEEALEAYKRAIELRPDRGNYIWEKKADIFHLLDQYEEAIKFYTLAIEFKPLGFSLLWSKMATVFSKVNRYEDAINALNKLEELNNGLFTYGGEWLRKGIFLEKLNRYEEALQVYDKASREGRSRAWSYKGILCEKLKRYEEALDALDEAMSVSIGDDEWENAWRCKAAILEKLGRHEEARQVFDEAKDLRSDSAKKGYEDARESALKGAKSVHWGRLHDAIKLDDTFRDKAKNDEAFKNFWDDEKFKRIVG